MRQPSIVQLFYKDGRDCQSGSDGYARLANCNCDLNAAIPLAK